MQREGGDYLIILEQTKKIYKPGTKIELIRLNDEYANLEQGDRGTVIAVDDIGTIHVRWDNGLVLGLIPDEDKFCLI